jgi:hypothetical protein
MALFGKQRDVSLLRHINREMMWYIISQQCAYYLFNYGDTADIGTYSPSDDDNNG